ncbi:TnpV protein, partial [Dysosmobacter welbionis]
PQQLCLSSIGRQRQQYACRQLHRRCGEKAQPRQKYRHGIGAPQQARQKVASPPEGNARQTRGAEHQQIVHQRVQHKHAVHIHHGQAIRLPSVPWDYYRADRREIRSQKGDAPCKKVRPPGSRLG